MAQKRLFVGLQFSENFKKELDPWIKKIKKTADKKETDLYWTLPDNLHVTLVFLGNTNVNEIPNISEKLKVIGKRHGQFKLKLRGLDGFPSLMQARVLFMAVQRSQALLDLQSDIEESLQPKKELERAFLPHLTLARLRNAKSCRDLVSPFAHIDLGKQPVFEVVLFSSEMRGPHVHYERLVQVPLENIPTETKQNESAHQDALLPK